MSINVDANTNRVQFKSSDGANTFDSADNNLLITNFVKTSFTIDRINNLQSADPILRTQTKVLSASLHPLARVVMGTQESNGRVWSIGGTRIVFTGYETLDPTPRYAQYLTGVGVIADAIWYYYEVTGGQLRVVINYRFCAGAAQTFAGETVRICAWVGTFDY